MFEYLNRIFSRAERLPAKQAVGESSSLGPRADSAIRGIQAGLPIRFVTQELAQGVYSTMPHLLGSFLMMPTVNGMTAGGLLMEPGEPGFDPCNRANLEELIRQLGSEDYDTRAAAQLQLFGLGLVCPGGVTQALRGGLNSVDAEVRAASREIVQALEQWAPCAYWRRKVWEAYDRAKSAAATGKLLDAATAVYDLRRGLDELLKHTNCMTDDELSEFRAAQANLNAIANPKINQRAAMAHMHDLESRGGRDESVVPPALRP